MFARCSKEFLQKSLRVLTVDVDAFDVDVDVDVDVLDVGCVCGCGCWMRVWMWVRFRHPELLGHGTGPYEGLSISKEGN